MESNQQAVNRLNQFLEVIRATPTESDCDQCLSTLETYVQKQLNNGAYMRLMPQTAHHLDSCQVCSEAYALLYELMWSEANGKLAVPPTIPQPDLNFLSATPTANGVQKRARLQQLLQHLYDRIILQFTADLLPLLQPPPTLAVTRLPGDSARYGELLLKMEATPEIGLPVTLAAYRDAQQAGLCLVEVTVEPPGQSWPDLGGKQVTVQIGERRETAVTDDWGLVYFPDIAIDHLAIMQLEVKLTA
ncbi:MAG: hypothetical protein R3E31_13055 [Chloroflexota bacterium]